MEKLFLQFLKMFEWSQIAEDSEGYRVGECPICDYQKPIHFVHCELEVMILKLEDKLGK